MKKKTKKKIYIKKVDKSEEGLIKTILIIVIAVFVVSYFDIDMKALLSSEVTKNNFSFVIELLGKVWEVLKPIWDAMWGIVGPTVKEGISEGIKSQL